MGILVVSAGGSTAGVKAEGEQTTILGSGNVHPHTKKWFEGMLMFMAPLAVG